MIRQGAEYQTIILIIQETIVVYTQMTINLLTVERNLWTQKE